MTATPPSRISWLHLSDFHLRVATGWAQDAVLSTMLTDIRARYGGNERPDLVFLTGDIAFSGKDEEYRLAEDFVRTLCSGIGLSLERICIVPGNHDIDLSREEDAVAGARHLLTSPIEVDRFLGNEGRRRTLFARQACFREFANRLLAPHPPVYSPTSYAHHRTIQLGALRVRVLLLDSTWLAGGGPSDAGGLLVGDRQVLDCGEPDGESLTFALVHHPFAWLREFEQVSVENLVGRCAHICMRGHVHAADFRRIDGPHGRLTTFTAGAAFQARTADNTYVWCSLDLLTGVGEKVVHRYRHAEHRWEAGAREPWELLPDAPAPSDLASIREALAKSGTRYPSYTTCLIGKLQAEVPVLLPSKKLAFIGCDTQIPTVQNRCGEQVRRLRNHFHWKRIWQSAAWEAQLAVLAEELGSILGEVESVSRDVLESRDESSAALLLACVGPSRVGSSACDEIRHLIGEGDYQRAHAVLGRWRGQEFLRPDEARELSRVEIVLLLAENNGVEANSRAAALISSAERTPDDVVLAARSAHCAKEHQRAATLMHEALDLGVDVKGVRVIARAIAGAVGDKVLVNRVR